MKWWLMRQRTIKLSIFWWRKIIHTTLQLFWHLHALHGLPPCEILAPLTRGVRVSQGNKIIDPEFFSYLMNLFYPIFGFIVRKIIKRACLKSMFSFTFWPKRILLDFSVFSAKPNNRMDKIWKLTGEFDKFWGPKFWFHVTWGQDLGGTCTSEHSNCQILVFRPL